MTVIPELIYPAGPCPYCRREIRCYGSDFFDTDTGQPHTCSLPADYRGPMYVNGGFYHTSLPIVEQNAEGDYLL